MWQRYSGTDDPHSQFDDLIEQATRRGIMIAIFAPLILIGGAHFLRLSGIGASPGQTPPNYDMLLMVFVAAGVAEVAAAFVLRRILFAPTRFTPIVADHPRVSAEIMRAAMIVNVVGTSPIVFGAILYLAGGDLREVVYFALLNLLAFRLLRPDAALLEKALGGETDNPG